MFILKFNLGTQNTLVGGQLGGLFLTRPILKCFCQSQSVNVTATPIAGETAAGAASVDAVSVLSG
jgi:hypothetical protein